MIDYSPFWKTLEISEENWYTLTKKYHMSSSTLYRLKHNQDISMKTVNDLCRILGCQIEDIAVYVPSDKDQKLCTIGQGPATIVRYDLLLLRQRGSYAGVFFYTILSLKIERINIK